MKGRAARAPRSGEATGPSPAASREGGRLSLARKAAPPAGEMAAAPGKPARPAGGRKPPAPGAGPSRRIRGIRLVVAGLVHRADAIVVLAGEKGERVDQGVKLHREGYAPTLLMSGGPSEANVPLARLMKEQAARAGVPEAAIVEEAESLDTGENARYSLRVARERGWRSIILVTSPYHARRAAKIFRSVFVPAGIEVVSCPAERSWYSADGWWTRKQACKTVLLEYAKTVWYAVSRLSQVDTEPSPRATGGEGGSPR